MSRSRKKNPHFHIIRINRSERRKVKKIENRKFRRVLNRGKFDEQIKYKNLNKRLSDLPYTYDMFTVYYDKDEYGENDWFKSAMRK